jgi:hypothetical protein
MAGVSIWERFPYDPRRPEHATLRASDRDRDVVNDVLGTAYAEGRLTPAELDERSDLVARATTLGALPAVLEDLVPVMGVPKHLVGERRGEAERRYRQRRQQALFSFLTPTLICWIVWLSVALAAHGPSFPWPAIVMIGTGMRYFRLVTDKDDKIVSIERDLEKRERKRLEEKERKKAKKALPPGRDDDEHPADPSQVNQG